MAMRTIRSHDSERDAEGEEDLSLTCRIIWQYMYHEWRNVTTECEKYHTNLTALTRLGADDGYLRR